MAKNKCDNCDKLRIEHQRLMELQEENVALKAENEQLLKACDTKKYTVDVLYLNPETIKGLQAEARQQGRDETLDEIENEIGKIKGELEELNKTHSPFSDSDNFAVENEIAGIFRAIKIVRQMRSAVETQRSFDDAANFGSPAEKVKVVGQ